MKFYNSNVKKGSFPFPIDDRYRGSGEVKRVPQAVLQIASIGETSGFWIIAKENESRRFNLNLVGEKDFEPAMVEVRSRGHILGVHKNLIKNIRRNPAVIAIVGFGDGRENLVDPLPRFRADKENRRVVKELKLIVNIIDEFLLIEFLGLAEIPFIDEDHDGFLFFHRVAHHVFVLFQDARGAINE